MADPTRVSRTAGWRWVALPGLGLLLAGTAWAVPAAGSAEPPRERVEGVAPGTVDEPAPAAAPAALPAAAPAAQTDQPPAGEPSPAAGDPAAPQAEAAPRDPCALPNFDPEQGTWLDWMQRQVYKSVCGSARWFDRMFGDDRIYEERDRPYGRLQVGVVYDERDGLDPGVRLRAKLPLPQLENRLSAFLGRTGEDEVVRDTDAFDELRSAFESRTEQEWLVGLGYTPQRNSRRRFDIDLGMKLNFPLDPFVKARYRINTFLSDRRLARFRQTVFYQIEEGFGATSRVDLEQILGDRFLLRLRNSGTFSQFSQGVEWESGLTLFHNLGAGRAMAYQLGISGDSDAPVTVHKYGVRIVYRQNIAREWLFLDLRPEVNWRRDQPGEPRVPVYALGFGFELHFGEKPY